MTRYTQTSCKTGTWSSWASHKPLDRRCSVLHVLTLECNSFLHVLFVYLISYCSNRLLMWWMLWQVQHQIPPCQGHLIWHGRSQHIVWVSYIEQLKFSLLNRKSCCCHLPSEFVQVSYLDVIYPVVFIVTGENVPGKIYQGVIVSSLMSCIRWCCYKCIKHLIYWLLTVHQSVRMCILLERGRFAKSSTRTPRVRC